MLNFAVVVAIDYGNNHWCVCMLYKPWLSLPRPPTSEIIPPVVVSPIYLMCYA